MFVVRVSNVCIAREIDLIAAAIDEYEHVMSSGTARWEPSTWRFEVTDPTGESRDLIHARRDVLDEVARLAFVGVEIPYEPYMPEIMLIPIMRSCEKIVPTKEDKERVVEEYLAMKNCKT